MYIDVCSWPTGGYDVIYDARHAACSGCTSKGKLSGSFARFTCINVLSTTFVSVGIVDRCTNVRITTNRCFTVKTCARRGAERRKRLHDDDDDDDDTDDNDDRSGSHIRCIREKTKKGK